MRIIENEQLDFEDVMLKPQSSEVNSRSDVDIYRTFEWTGVEDGEKRSFKAIPVTSANMYSTGNILMCGVLSENGMMGCLEKHIKPMYIGALYRGLVNVSKDAFYRVFTSIGLRDDIDTLTPIREEFPDVSICIDAPHGAIPKMYERIEKIRSLFPNSFLMAGNVADENVIAKYASLGVNCVKGGISGGSLCLTRYTSGAGRPVFQTALELSKLCHSYDMYYCSDGGCKCCADVVKALAVGSDMVMTNALFCKTEEATGEIVEKDGKKYRRVFGMSSLTAQEKLFGGFRKDIVASEGRDVLVEIDGKLEDRIQKINGSIRSGCSYSNASNLDELRENAVFYKVRRNLNGLFGNCEKMT